MSRRRLIALVIGAVVAAAVACAGLAAVRLTAPLPQLGVSARVPATLALAPGTPPPVPVPAAGSFALNDGATALASRDPAAARPIGSVAKTMTALLVLIHHPLAPGENGPLLTLTADDVALYRQAVAQQGSYLPVAAGEQLSERQLLLALLLPSANNIAETLARWIGGSRDAFIAALNAQAHTMGMLQTHFDDPSGYSPATVSSAGDLVLLGRAVVAQPALVELVSTQAATLPDGLVLRNLDTLLASEPGWVGIKTGWTPQAGGCLLFAARQQPAPDAAQVQLVGAVLGQPPDAAVDPGHPELGGAFRAAGEAVRTALAGYAVASDASELPELTGALSARWGATARLAAAFGPGEQVVVRRGVTAALTLRLRPLAAPLRAGAVAGEITAEVGGRPVLRWPVVITQDLGSPDWTWRLFH